MVDVADVYLAIFGVPMEDDWALYPSILEGRREHAEAAAMKLRELGYAKVLMSTPQPKPPIQPRIVPKVPSGVWFRIDDSNLEIFHMAGMGVDFVYYPQSQEVVGPVAMKVRVVP